MLAAKSFSYVGSRRQTQVSMFSNHVVHGPGPPNNFLSSYVIRLWFSEAVCLFKKESQMLSKSGKAGCSAVLARGTLGGVGDSGMRDGG